MFSSRRSLEQLVKLQEETNSLLRELLIRQGLSPRTPRTAGLMPTRIYTAEDVTVVDRSEMLRQEAENQAKRLAPWRTPTPAPTGTAGPGSAPTPPSSGETLGNGNPGSSPAISRG